MINFTCSLHFNQHKQFIENYPNKNNSRFSRKKLNSIDIYQSKNDSKNERSSCFIIPMQYNREIYQTVSDSNLDMD